MPSPRWLRKSPRQSASSSGSHVPQNQSRFFAIVEVNGSIRQNLSILMSLSGEYYHIAIASFFEDCPHRALTVKFNPVLPCSFLESSLYVRKDLIGVLASGIVRRNPTNISHLFRSSCHQ